MTQSEGANEDGAERVETSATKTMRQAMTHEAQMAGARRYHAGNQVVVNARQWGDAATMLKMRTPGAVQERVAEIVDEIMAKLALMRRHSQVSA